MGEPERGRHEDLTSPLEPHRAKRKSASLSQLFAHKDSSDTSKGLMRIPLLFNENFVEMEPSASRPHDAAAQPQRHLELRDNTYSRTNFKPPPHGSVRAPSAL